MKEELNYQISEIKTYIKDIENLNIKSKEDFLNNRSKKLASSMAIFNILNSCIEIGELIISNYDFESPMKYRDIFKILKENKILSKDISSKLENYMYHRNMLAHNYGKINFEEIYDLIINKDIFLKFINEITNYILKN
jgi:uncharacterized protein YutE (UPF0331/DUF86 family)